MGCRRPQKEFDLPINGKHVKLIALDECVWATIISFPADDEEIAEMMWEQVGLYNQIDPAAKTALLPVLLDFYKKHQAEFATKGITCTGFTDCQ